MLFAHHEDDVAETVLMRLISKATIAGLCTLRSAAGIPECYGMHGICESTAISPLTDDAQSSHPAQIRHDSGVEDPAGRAPIMISLPLETGGVTIHRPLLSFPKARLQVTCQELGIEWAEDESNSDVTFTARNAIRGLLRADRLPVALQKPSLLALARRSNEIVKNRKARANQLFDKCEILSFDSGTGTTIIRLPSQHSLYDSNSIECLDHVNAGYFLRKIIRIVSPRENVPLRSLDKTIEIMFPHIMQAERMPRNTQVKPNAEKDPGSPSNVRCTIAGVQITKSSLLEFPPILTLQRMPFYKTQYPRPIPIYPSKYYPLEADSDPQTYLWDGRFWLNIRNRTSQVLYIGLLSESQVKEFGFSLHNPKAHFEPSPESRRFAKVMKGLVHPSVRLTLPAIVRRKNATTVVYQGAGKEGNFEEKNERVRDLALASETYVPGTGTKPHLLVESSLAKQEPYMTAQEVEDIGEVIALPTLGFVSSLWKDSISWSCKYKKVDLGGREMRVIQPGLARYDSVTEGIPATQQISKKQVPLQKQMGLGRELGRERFSILEKNTEAINDISDGGSAKEESEKVDKDGGRTAEVLKDVVEIEGGKKEVIAQAGQSKRDVEAKAKAREFADEIPIAELGEPMAENQTVDPDFWSDVGFSLVRTRGEGSNEETSRESSWYPEKEPFTNKISKRRRIWNFLLTGNKAKETVNTPSRITNYVREPSPLRRGVLVEGISGEPATPTENAATRTIRIHRLTMKSHAQQLQDKRQALNPVISRVASGRLIRKKSCRSPEPESDDAKEGRTGAPIRKLATTKRPSRRQTGTRRPTSKPISAGAVIRKHPRREPPTDETELIRKHASMMKSIRMDFIRKHASTKKVIRTHPNRLLPRKQTPIPRAERQNAIRLEAARQLPGHPARNPPLVTSYSTRVRKVQAQRRAKNRQQENQLQVAPTGAPTLSRGNGGAG